MLAVKHLSPLALLSTLSERALGAAHALAGPRQDRDGGIPRRFTRNGRHARPGRAGDRVAARPESALALIVLSATIILPERLRRRSSSFPARCSSVSASGCCALSCDFEQQWRAAADPEAPHARSRSRLGARTTTWTRTRTSPTHTSTRTDMTGRTSPSPTVPALHRAQSAVPPQPSAGRQPRPGLAEPAAVLPAGVWCRPCRPSSCFWVHWLSAGRLRLGLVVAFGLGMAIVLVASAWPRLRPRLHRRATGDSACRLFDHLPPQRRSW